MQSGRGNSWIGWLIFIVLIFGGRFLPPVAAWLSQVTGLPITVPTLIIAVIALSVVGSVVSSVARQVGKARGPGDTRLPTTVTMAPPSSPSSPPPASMRPPPPSSAPSLPSPRLPSGEQRLPGPPKFEPIIDPRILTFGILGLLVLGGAFVVLLALGGALP